MKNHPFPIFCVILTFFVSLIVPFKINAQIYQTKTIARNNADFKRNTVNNISELESQVFEIINKKRKENGLPPLVWNNQIAGVARLHSKNMAGYGFFSHVGIDGKEVDDRADSLGLRKWRMIGENIAYNRGYGNPVERAVEAWMKSAGHRQNILKSNWKETGVGIAVSATGEYYFTQVFILK